MKNEVLWFFIFLIIGLFLIWGIAAFIVWDALWFIHTVVGRILGVIFFFAALSAAVRVSDEFSV